MDTDDIDDAMNSLEAIIDEKRKPRLYATNAPAHWPPIEGPALLCGSDPRSTASRAVALMRTIAAAIKSTGADLRVGRPFGTILSPSCAFRVPMTVSDGDLLVPVFVFGAADAEAAAAFALAEELLASAEQPAPVYFAPADLPAADPAPLEVMKTVMEPRLLKRLTEDQSTPAGSYAMWWGLEGDTDPGTSEDLDVWDAIYTTCDGIETYLHGFLLSQFEMIDASAGLADVDLPEDESLVVYGPESQPIIISLSSEKGIRFHFHTEKCSRRYRQSFLEEILRLYTGIRNAIESSEIPTRELSENPAAWWRYLRGTLAEKSKNDESSTTGGQLVGAIFIEE